jgi:hypothetical protein
VNFAQLGFLPRGSFPAYQKLPGANAQGNLGRGEAELGKPCCKLCFCTYHIPIFLRPFFYFLFVFGQHYIYFSAILWLILL